MTTQLLKTSTDDTVLFDGKIFANWTDVWGSPGYFMSEHKIFRHHHQHKISRQYVISGSLDLNFVTTGAEVSLLSLLTNLYSQQKGECKDVNSQIDNTIYTKSL
eukprot:381213_1